MQSLVMLFGGFFVSTHLFHNIFDQLERYGIIGHRISTIKFPIRLIVDANKDNLLHIKPSQKREIELFKSLVATELLPRYGCKSQGPRRRSLSGMFTRDRKDYIMPYLINKFTGRLETKLGSDSPMTIIPGFFVSPAVYKEMHSTLLELTSGIIDNRRHLAGPSYGEIYPGLLEHTSDISDNTGHLARPSLVPNS